ncbi:related to glyoxylate/hydroxypyruvate reductase [Ustilago trichophora]|uniref:Related to glyoxylate/hydroxypyruvate reductase n=1 Tax=Ustilago trichophora TaxID=86804 RepID=A0A5C3E203_9BASI|nr:related to glyoxylate/hydroxypyruvate reductase [Ustilago trichophora]
MDDSAAPVTSVKIPKIVTIFERLPSQILDRLSAEGRINLVTPPPGLTFAELNTWLLNELDGASAAIVWPVAVSFGQDHLAAANPSQHGVFRVVSTYSVGTEAIDKPACRAAGVKVGYTPYIGDDSIAEYTIAMLLHFCRRIESLKGTVMEGRFPQAMREVLLDPTLDCGFSPMGKTICFYGFGRIAQKTVEKLLPFGVAKILYTTSKAHPFDSTNFPRLHALREAFYPQIPISNEPSLPALASEADILIILCPGNATTNSTINSSIFSQMKPSSILINVARGTVVVNDDLERALRSNQIAAALLDVVQGEPHLDKNHPLMAQDLKQKVMILPHAASTVVETRNLMADVAARNVLTCLGFEDDVLGDDRERLVRERAWTHFAE